MPASTIAGGARARHCPQDLRLKRGRLGAPGLAHIQARRRSERGLQCCNEALALRPHPTRCRGWPRWYGVTGIKAGRLDDGIAELSELSLGLRAHTCADLWSSACCGLPRAIFAGRSRHARPLDRSRAQTSRTTGYLHYEGRACWLMGECLAAEVPASAEDHVETRDADFRTRRRAE